VFRKRFERRLVVERERRDNDTHTDLESAARAPLGILPVGTFPEKVADRCEHTFLLDKNRRVAETRRKFERVNTVVVDDAVEVDVADVAFERKLGLHLEQ